MASPQELKEKLILHSGVGVERIESLIESKKKEFTGVSEEGVISLVARELGVNIFSPFRKEIKIGNIAPNMRNITFIGKITDVSPVREFEREGRKGRVRNITIEDETGKIRVSLWNDEIEKYNFTVGDVVKTDNCSTRMNTFGNAEARISFGTMTKSENAIEVKGPKTSLSGAEENDNVVVEATLLHIFERQMIYYFCSKCRARLSDGMCAEHGIVEPNKTLIVSGLIDDGTSTMNAVFFNNTAENLLGTKTGEIEEQLKSKTPSDVIMDSNALTKKFKIVGTTKRNQLTNDLELRVRNVG